MIHEDIVNNPIKISKKEVVLVIDKINPVEVTSDFIVISRDTATAVVNSNEIDALKKKFPNEDFYGFWMTLLISEVIEPNGLQVYYTAEYDGYYIYTKNGEVLETGSITASHAPSNYKLNFNTAKSIDFELNDLKIPDRKIKSTADIYRGIQLKKDDIKKGVIRGAFLATIIIASSIYFMEQMQKMVYEELAKDKALDQQLNQAFKSMKDNKYKAKIDQSPQINQILNIQSIAMGKFKIPQQSLEGSKPKEAFINPVVPNPKSVLLPSIKVKSFNEKKGWELEW